MIKSDRHPQGWRSILIRTGLLPRRMPGTHPRRDSKKHAKAPTL